MNKILNRFLKGTALSLFGIVLTSGVLAMAPNHAQAAVTVWNQSINNNGYGATGLKKLYAYPEWTSAAAFLCVMDCIQVTHPAGMAENFPLKFAIDKAGAAAHATNVDSLTWFDYPNSGTEGNLPAFAWNVHGGSPSTQSINKTGGEVCKIIDSTSTATWTTGSYNSPDNNKLIRYGQVAPGNVWQVANANDIGNSYIANLTCSTTALPVNTLSASPTSITSGQSSTITFDAGANSEAQSTVCTPVNFTVPTHERAIFGSAVLTAGASFFGGPDTTTYQYVGIPVGEQLPDTSGSVIVSPTVTTTYEYNCTNGNGTTVRTATVTVGTPPPPVPTVTFGRSPATIAAGGSSTLTWSSTNATSCTSGNFATGGATSGTASVSPGSTTTYSISCTGAGGTSPVSNATVNVTGNIDLSAGPLTTSAAVAGSPVTFSSTISNNGSASTGVGFQNVFEVDVDTDHTAITASVTDTSPALVSGATDVTTTTYTPASAGTWYVRVCADSGAVIAESNEGNNCTGWTSVTVTATGPNLSAGSVSPGSATVGTPVTLSSTITNSGNTTTGAGFTNLFQRATDSSGTGSTDIGTHTSAALGVGTNTATLSYTFPSAATWYVRVCADKNSAAGTGTITETSEADNCGSWTPITATAGTAPDVIAADNTTTTATAGTAVTLSSVVTNSGNASTVTTFTDVFQKATDVSGTGATVIGTFTNPIRPASTNGAATLSYTFPTVGTTYIRVCADNNASMVGTIAESNEGNNCSNWAPVTVTASAGINLTPDDTTPSSAVAGTSVTLSSVVRNNGTASTVTTFTNVFQTAANASGAGLVVVGTVTNPVRAGNTFGASTISYTFASAGTFYTRICVDNNAVYAGTITETNEGDNCSTWTPITVTSAPAGSDLIAGAVTPIDSYSGVAITLNAQITNQGTVSTGAGFTNVFQSATDISGTGASSIGTVTNVARAAGTSNTASLSHTFSTSGLKYIRVCADNNASMVGAITESNESNNCGAWTEISVTSPAASPWVGQGCGDITQSYNGSCNKWAEPLDITCPEGERLDVQDTTCPIATNNGPYKRSARCVVDSACSAPPPSSACVINTTVGVNVPATIMVERGSNQTVQVGIGWGDRSVFVTSGDFTSGSCYPAWNLGCNGSYDTNVLGGSYGNQHIYTEPGTYEMVAYTQNGFTGGEVIGLNGTWGGSDVSCTVNVAGPNLITGGITPITASVGTAVSLSATVTNNGTVQTGAMLSTFTDVYQSATDAAGTGAAVIGTASHNRLTAGASSASTLSYTFGTAGTVFVRACADNNASFVGTVAETNELDNCGAWTQVTVAGANLTATAPTPTAATAGVAVTLSSTIANTGVASTGTTFTDVFQKATDASGTGATVIGTFANPIRAANTSGAATLSYTFATPGTTYVRACADNNASFVGTIAETNELDNCSAWTAVTVSGANLTAGPITPISATAGVAVTLTSTVNNTGPVSTGTTFTDVFQTATSAAGAGATVIGTYTNPVLASAGSVGASGAATLSYVFPSGGVKYVRACADNNASFVGTIAEMDENDNCGVWTAVTVTASVATGPDLLASDPTPTTAVAGTSKNFTSTITNAGVATTGKTITNLFQFDNNTDHSSVTAFDTDTSPTLIAGATDASIGTYTFPTSGTWYVRACADNDQWFTSFVDEGANEGNNCSNWVPVTVSGPASAGVTSCSVNPGSIASGASATWSALPAGLGTYTWAPSEGGAPGGTGATLVRSYTGTNATFGMAVTAGGSTVNCPNLTVGGSPFGPADPVVTMNPPRVVPGGTTVLTINATGVDTSCVVSGPGITTTTILGVGGTIPTTTITTGVITNQATYTVNCDGEGPVKAIVNIIPAVQEF